MKAAMVLFRVVSILVLLASLLTVSGTSASNKIPVNLTICAQEIRLISSEPLVLGFTSVMIPDDGPNGKEGLEGTVTGATYIKVKPNATDGDANLMGLYEFTGRVWEAGNPVWSGHLRLLEVGHGGPDNVVGSWRTLDSRVHFVGTMTTSGAAAKCADKGYFIGGHLITGQLHITPAGK